MTYAIGIDVGGTFTDLVALDERGGLVVHKVLTTADPSDGALAGATELLRLAEIRFADVDLVVHSTTLITNALIERTGAPTALLATQGFRDVLEMRTEQRYDLYDLFLRWPDPLVPRERRLGIAERMTRDGVTLTAPDAAEVAAAADRLVGEGVEAIAIAFLHAYRDGRHERDAAAQVRRRHPGLTVTLSSDVAPVIGEYERTSTAVAEAYVQRLARTYIARMERGLREAGYAGPFLLTLSDGGAATASVASRTAIRLVESGPAAGAAAAARYGHATASDLVLAFDMGGTTAKVSLIEGGQARITTGIEVARAHRLKRGSGMPLAIPSVDLIEIGAGGGSIASFDAAGRLQVGPRSAGARPGPACYARGGTLPTVTDADLVLGYLDPAMFLGGRMRLDVAAATDALGALAARAEMSVADVAAGVHDLVNAGMAEAARVHLVERNWDPRRVSLVAFGGAGPVHAAAVAAQLGIARIVYPLGAGVTSAVGSIVAPLSFSFARSAPAPLARLTTADANALLAALEASAREALADAGVIDGVRISRSVDMRMIGQMHDVAVPLPDGPLGPRTADLLRDSFNAIYRRLYALSDPSAALEIVTWRLTAQGPARPLPGLAAATARTGAARGTRPLLMPGRRHADATVYDRYALGPSTRIEGPALVEERETTVFVPPSWTATVDDRGDLVAERA